MAESQINNLLDQKTLIYVPCKSKNIKEEMESENNAYSLKLDGEIYYDEKKECIFGANKINKDAINNKYSKLILKNNDLTKNINSPIILEFYAEPSENLNFNNNFLKIYFLSINDNKKNILDINLINISINDEYDTMVEMLLKRFDAYNKTAYYFIQIDPNNGKLEIYRNNIKVYSEFHTKLQNIVIDQIEFYLGMVMLKRSQRQINVYSGEFQNDPSILYTFDTTIYIQHNIYYNNFKLSTGRYDENDISNRLNYVKSQKFLCITKIDTEKITISSENKYIDGSEIVDIIANKTGNPIKDIGMINKIVNNPNFNSSEKLLNVVYENGKFGNKPKDTSIFLQNNDTTITSIANNSIIMKDFTIETDIIISNIFNMTYLSIFSIYNDSGKPILQLVCNGAKNNCELIFTLYESNTGYLLNEYKYETYYNFINRIVIMRSNNTFYIFINNENVLNKVISNMPEFSYNKTVIGKFDNYQNFTGYIGKFILSNKARYSYQGIQLQSDINKLYENSKINFFSIHNVYNTIRQKSVKNAIYTTPYVDNNYLLYMDFVNNNLFNRGKYSDLSFKYDSNHSSTPSFISNEFPGDSYSEALITEAKSKLSIRNAASLNLADMTNFTLEVDFKIIGNIKLCKFIKLFSNDTLNSYLTFENDGYPVFYIGNKYGKQIKLKHYYPLLPNNIIHLVLQKISNTFYFIIDDTIVFINSVSDLSQFFIENLYDNQSSVSLMYINRFSISNITRYDIRQLKNYALDTQSLLYLPYDTQSNFIMNKFPKSEDNMYTMSISKPIFYKDYFKENYGSIGYNSTLYFTLPNKNYDSENISLYFWNRLVANSNLISNLNCTILKLRDNSFNNIDSDIYELEIKIINNSTIGITSTIINPNGNRNNLNETESLAFNTNDYTKSLFNTWNNFAVTYDVYTSIFTLFINGSKIYSDKLNYFKAKSIVSIALFTEYTYSNANSIGEMYLSSIRISKGIYYVNNFLSNVSGLINKSYADTIEYEEPEEKQEIIYTKYPSNTTERATEITNKHEIPINEQLTDYLTLETWIYTTENKNNDISQLSISFVQDVKILYTLYLTRKNAENCYIRNSTNVTKNMSSKLFPIKQWVNIALTYNRISNELKIWLNGKLILHGNYFDTIPLTKANKLVLYPGTGISYINDFKLEGTLKYMTDTFVPFNSLSAADAFSSDEYQNIPYLIYNKHVNGNTTGSISIGDTGFVKNLYNNSDTGHTIEFWLYTTKNERVTSNPLTINIMAAINYGSLASIHEIILNRYIIHNTDDIHWTDGIAPYQNSGIVLNPEKWLHFALVYNKIDNTIQLYYNGKRILNSVFAKNISLTTFKQIIISTGSGETYIEGFMQSPQALYSTDFIPNNSSLSGIYLPIYDDETEEKEIVVPTKIIENSIGNLDEYHITYLDFNDYSLKDQSKSQVDWKAFGTLQYVKDKFSHDPNGRALLLTGSNGIYTNDASLNFNNLNNFTIEMEIKNYNRYQSKAASLFINFVSWVTLSLSNNTITANYHTDPNITLSSSNNLNINNMVYIALQKKDNLLSLYINGTMVSKAEIKDTAISLENFIALYAQNKSFDHIIDIGMTYDGQYSTTSFFSGYINKIAISDIARFDDGGSTSTIEEVKNELIVFYQPIKNPDYEALYRTTPKTEPWFWQYSLTNSRVYTDKSVGYNIKWKNYASIGPNSETKLGYIEYTNMNLYNKTFTFEFWAQKDTNIQNDIESKILTISNNFLLSSGSTGPIISKYENGNYVKLTEMDMEYNIFDNRWNHYAITYNYFTKSLCVFINGKLLFITIDFNELVPSIIHLHTNSTTLNSTYFASIRYSKGIIYTQDFNLSLVNKPFIDYEDNDKVDFNNLFNYESNENNVISSSAIIRKNINEDVIFYLPFKNGVTDGNDLLAPGVKSQFNFTSNNSDLYRG